MKTTDPQTGQTVRGFHVHVHAPATRRRKACVLRYPCSGHPPFTGAQAIDCMARLTKRGFKCVAWTLTLEQWESLTLEEMREVIL